MCNFLNWLTKRICNFLDYNGIDFCNFWDYDIMDGRKSHTEPSLNSGPRISV